MRRVLLTLFACLLLASCQTIKSRIAAATGLEQAKEKEIAALQADFAQKLEQKAKELETARTTQLAAKDAQMVAAAGAFYGQNSLFGTLLNPTRTDLVWRNLAQEGWAALGNVMPTYDAIAKLNERLKTDLDTTKTSLTDLQKTHDTAMAESAKVSDAAKAAADRLAKLQQEKTDMELDYKTKLATKEGERANLAQQNAALQKERADDAAAIQALKTKVSVACAAFALLCAAGAIYSPVGKGGLAALSAVTAIAGAAIWVITGAMVLYTVLGCVVVLICWALYKHHASDKTVTALTGYLHEKGQLAEADLAAWTTKYVKAPDGSTTTIPDKAVLATINSSLTAANKL